MILEHFEPEAVTDSTSRPVLARNAALSDADSFDIGGIYYICEPSILFTPAHSILFLDKFFESTAVGSAPFYDRAYETEHIDSEPSTPFINLWKRTAKVGHDHNLCLYNGLVTGITISKEPGRPVIMRPRLAFGARSFAESNPAAWSINRSDGYIDPIIDGEILCYFSTPGGSLYEFKVTEFSITLSCEFMPHFWGSQNPDRFSRGRKVLQGSFVIRDIVDQVEEISEWMEASTTKTAFFVIGKSALSMLYFNFNVHAGGGGEDEITRHGRFNFTGVYESDATFPTGFRLNVRAGRPYTP